MPKNHPPKYYPSFTAYLADVPPKVLGTLYEIRPPQDAPQRPDPRFLQTVADPVPRALEIWRELDGKIRICLFGDEATVNIFASAYPGSKIDKVTATEPDFVKTLEKSPVFFSVELAHSLPFSAVEVPNLPAFVDNLIRLMPPGTWLQLVFQSFQFGGLAEQAAMAWTKVLLDAKKKKETVEYKGGSSWGVKTEAPATEITSSTVVQMGGAIAEDAFRKAHASGIILHIRGLTVQGGGWLDAALASIEIQNDFLCAYGFEDPRALRWMRARAIPNPTPFLEMHAKGGFLKAWGRGRELVPCLCLTPTELPVFIHLPTDPNLPVNWTRSVGVPTMVSTPKSFGDLLAKIVSLIVTAANTMITGLAGCGKSTLLIKLLRALDRLEPETAKILLDPHGGAAADALHYFPHSRLDYWSLRRTGGSFNALEIFKCRPEEREYIVSLMRQVTEKMIETTTATSPENAQRMFNFCSLWIGVQYALGRDDPTFADLYFFAAAQAAGEGQAMLGDTVNRLVKAGFKTLSDAFETICKAIPKDGWLPIMHRFALYATDPLTSRAFCSVTTIKPEEMVKPGCISVVSLEGVGVDYARFAMAAFIIRLWLYLQELYYAGKKVKVILAIDEFQLVGDLEIVNEIVAQARKYGLRLILVYQSLAQLSDVSVKVQMTNCAVKLSGRTSGADAAIIAANWDPKYREEIKQGIATQPFYNFYAAVAAVGSEEQAPPAQYLVPAPEAPPNSEQEIEGYVEARRRKIQKELEAPVVPQFRSEKTKWQKYLPVSVVLPEREWKLLLAIFRKGPMTYSKTCAAAVLERDPRGPTKQAWDSLVAGGWLATRREKIAAKTVEVADLSEKAKNYFTAIRNFSAIGGKEGQARGERAWTYHAVRSRFVSVVSQKPTEERPDLVAYDYGADSATAIEIESAGELKTHPEQTAANVKKFRPAEADALEFWVPDDWVERVKGIVADFPRETALKVTVHGDAEAEQVTAEKEEAPEEEEAEAETEPEKTEELHEEIVIRKRVTPTTVSEGEKTEPAEPKEEKEDPA